MAGMQPISRSCFLLLLLALLGALSCQRRDELEIAVVPKSQAHIFWQSVHAGAQAAGREFGVRVLWNAPASEIEFSRQMNIVEDFINRGVDGIVLAPSHGEALVPVVERAGARGIPVVIFDSGIETDAYVSYVATDNYQGGVVGARRLAERLGSRGKVALIGVIPGAVSVNEREDGFRETLQKEFPELELVAFQYGMGEQARSMAVAEDIINANPDLDGIFAANESSTVGAVQAVKTLGKAGRIVVVGFDSSPTLIEDLKDGVLDSLVHQDPFRIGYEGVRAMVLELQGETPPRRVDTGVYLITRESLEDPEIQRLLDPPISEYLF